MFLPKKNQIAFPCFTEYSSWIGEGVRLANGSVPSTDCNKPRFCCSTNDTYQAFFIAFNLPEVSRLAVIFMSRAKPSRGDIWTSEGRECSTFHILWPISSCSTAAKH